MYKPYMYLSSVEEVNEPPRSPYKNVAAIFYLSQLVTHTGAPIHHHGPVDSLVGKLSGLVVDLQC